MSDRQDPITKQTAPDESRNEGPISAGSGIQEAGPAPRNHAESERAESADMVPQDGSEDQA
jgi:hypothetical protein